MFDFLQFSLADKGLAVGMRQFLYEFPLGYGPGSFCQKGQFIQVFGYLLFGLVLLHHCH